MKKKQKLLLPFIICSVAASFYIYDYILRIMPQAMTRALMQSFHINAGELGLLASLFFWGYAPMQIPVGMLFDRFSARLLLTVTLLLSSFSVLGFAFAHSYTAAAIFRFVMGVMTSFSFVGALVVGVNWFRGQYFAFYTGLVQFLGCMGAILGLTPVVLLTRHHDWRVATLWIAIFGFILTVLMWFVVRDVPTLEREKPRKRILTKRPPSYRTAFSNPQTWWVALYGFAVWSPVTIFAILWGVPYLHDVYHFAQVDAGTQISIIWFTIAIGGPLVGWFSKHIQQRRLPMIICSILGMTSSLAIIHFTHLSQMMLAGLFIIFGLGASGLVVAFGLVVDIQPPETVGAIVGFTNMAVILGGLTLQPVVGFVIQHLWKGATKNGIHVYSHHAYEIALLTVPLSFLLTLITALLIKETHCKKQYKY